MTRSGPRRAAPGFTLLEIAVALAIGGIAVLGATGLFIALAGRDEAIRASAARNDRAANGEQLLRALFGNLEVSTDSATALGGDSVAVTFRAGCRSVGAELDHCGVRLYFEQQGPITLLQLRLTTDPNDSAGVHPAIELRRGGRGVLRYLIDAGGGGRWADSWSRLQPPVAVSVVVDGDTLLLPVWGND